MAGVCASQLGWIDSEKPEVDFAVGHMNKDLEYFTSSIGGTESPFVAAVTNSFKRTEELHTSSADFSAVMRSGRHRDR